MRGIKTEYIYLFKHIKKYKKYVIVSIISLIILSINDGILYKFLIPNLIDEGFINQDSEFLLLAPLYVVITFFLRGIVSFLFNYMIGYVGKNFACKIRAKVIIHTLYLPNKFFYEHSTGKLVSKINYDIEQVSTAITEGISEFLKGIFIFIVLAIIIASINIYVFLIIIFFVLIFTYILKKIGFYIKQFGVNTQTSIGVLISLFKEITNLQKVIKLYDAKSLEINKILFMTTKNKKNELKTLFLQSISIPFVQIIGAVTLSFILILYYSNVIKISVGEFASILAAILSLLKPIKQVALINTLLQKGLAGIQSILNLINTKRENIGNLTMKYMKKDIIFNNVYFKYENSKKYAISNINLKIDEGDIIGLIGSSGSGKSTLISLIQKLNKITKGRILINNKNIDTIPTNIIRENTSTVCQTTLLFNDTISYNIAYNDKHASKKKILRVIKKSNCMTFINDLSHDIHSKIGENGCILSGGQRQKIAIARAIFKDASVLILDEATSALDEISDLVIKNYIKKNIGKKTIIVITHKIRLLSFVKKIIVMKDGEIKKIGSYNDLIKNHLYKKFM